MSDLSQRLQAAIGHLLQDEAKTGAVFNAGASDAEFSQLEQLIQAKLPEDFKALYHVFNGQAYEEGYVFDGEEWLSLERMAEEWEVWKGLLDDGEFDDDEEEADEDADPEVNAVWWSPLWIPFTYDGSGNHLCLDLDPTAEGTYGQVIRMWHDDPQRSLEGKTFADWVETYIRGMEEGLYVYSEDYGGIFKKDDIIAGEDGEY